MIAHTTIKIARFLAKYSCPKWNHGTGKVSNLIHRALRKLCRYGLWTLAITDNFIRIACHSMNGLMPSLNEVFDPYPPLFRCINIEEEGALVVDPAKFVLNHSTSFCAFMIFLLTGKWPTKKVTPKDQAEYDQRERKHDAKYWLEFLEAQDCYDGIVDRPYNGAYFIGVDPDYGEYGLVVWFAGIPDVKDPSKLKLTFVSTYINHEFYHATMRIEDFTWVRIKKGRRT